MPAVDALDPDEAAALDQIAAFVSACVADPEIAASIARMISSRRSVDTVKGWSASWALH